MQSLTSCFFLLVGCIVSFRLVTPSSALDYGYAYHMTLANAKNHQHSRPPTPVRLKWDVATYNQTKYTYAFDSSKPIKLWENDQNFGFSSSYTGHSLMGIRIDFKPSATLNNLTLMLQGSSSNIVARSLLKRKFDIECTLSFDINQNKFQKISCATFYENTRNRATKDCSPHNLLQIMMNSKQHQTILF